MSLSFKNSSIIKAVVLLAAYGYLAYVLISFQDYVELVQQWSAAWHKNLLWLLAVLALLPLNWLLETVKWQYLVKDVEALSLTKAFRSVLGGNTTAFFTPNRLGEFPGRSLFMQEGNRLKAALLGMFGGVSQTLVIMLCGLPSLILLLGHFQGAVSWLYVLLALLCFSFLVVIYFSLPRISAKLKSSSLFARWSNYLACYEQLSALRLIQILACTLARYLVFCAQLYFMLRFFCVELNVLTAMLAIAVNYLFVTFAPSWAFSEGAVRASTAVVVLGLFSANVVGIAAAGVSIWLINFVLPMLAGSIFLSKAKI